MLPIITTAVNAISPVILLIALGYFLKQRGFLSESFSKTANQLVFQICIPAMLIVNLYDIEGLAGINWSIGIYCVCAAAVLFLFGLVLSLVFTRVPERRGVILQCTFRSNFAIIGIPMANALGGAAAVAVAAVISAVTIPLFNVFAVVALSMFLEEGISGGKLKSVLRNIVTNPLIRAVAVGLGILALREAQLRLFGQVRFSLQRDLKLLYTTLSHLKSMTTPLALIVLGSQFEFSAFRGMAREVAAGTVGRVLLAPIVGIGGAILLSCYTGLLSCGVNEYPALVALFGSPVAVSSAVMADSMGNDKQLAAQLVVWTSLISMFTIFLQVCVLLWFGYLAIP